MAKIVTTLTERQALNRVAKAAKLGLTDNQRVGYCEIRYARARKTDMTPWPGSKRTVEEQQAVIDESASRGCDPEAWCVVKVLVTRVEGGTEWKTGQGRAGGSYLAKLPSGTVSVRVEG